MVYPLILILAVQINLAKNAHFINLAILSTACNVLSSSNIVAHLCPLFQFLVTCC